MKAAIFDIDGTLIESMAVDCDLYVSAIQSVIGPVQFRPRFSDYENVTDGGILEQVFIDNSLAIDLQAIDSIKTAFIARLDAHILGAGPFPESFPLKPVLIHTGDRPGFDGLRQRASLKIVTICFIPAKQLGRLPI